MSVEELDHIGQHNQPVIAASIWERMSDSRITRGGDINKPFVAASIAKVYLVAAMQKLYQEGSFDLSQSFPISLGEYMNGGYGTGELKYRYALTARGYSRFVGPETPVTLRPIPAEKLLELMITRSDNLATLVMVNRAGRENIQQVIDYFGMRDTTIFNPQTGTDNITTAADVHSFLHQLYRGVLITRERAEDIKEWLPDKQRVKNYDYTHSMRSIHGKIAEGERSFYHRVGFIEGGFSGYCFVVLTEGRTVGTGEIPVIQERKVPEILGKLTTTIF